MALLFDDVPFFILLIRSELRLCSYTLFAFVECKGSTVRGPKPHKNTQTPF